MNKRKNITRRDFLDGVAISIATAAVVTSTSAHALSGGAAAASDPTSYPPQFTGMRGNHPGSFDAAHPLAWYGDAPHADNDTSEEYDLVVVGAGLSGLAAATLFQRERGSNQRILLLDNHDDFGGHAKRNEFTSDGHMLLGIGGSINLEAPAHYSEAARRLLEEIGIDLEQLAKAMDPKDPMVTLGGESGIFIKAGDGKGEMIAGNWRAAFSGQGDYIALINQLPLAQSERDRIIQLASGELNYLEGFSDKERGEYLSSTSYHEFLLDKVQLAPATLSLFDSWLRLLFGVGGDGISVSEAFKSGAPGVGSVGIASADEPSSEEDNSYQSLYFPDGNASVARLMVRKLIPAVAAGNSLDDIATARFDYDKLDTDDGPVRLRLNSTVVRAHQQDDQVAVTYVQDGKATRVQAKHCIMACYNSIIPHLCPELPDPQKEALKYGSKIPLIWTNVDLRKGTPFYKAGAQLYECPDGYFTIVTKAPSSKVGNYQPPQNPDDPLVVFMMRSPVAIKQPGQTARDLFRLARHELLNTPFSTFEQEIREQLTGLFGSHGFDADRDIEAITVNRWAHGYAYEYYSLDDGPFTEGAYPHQIGRQQFSQISIANSDSEASAYLDSAIDAAWRATQEQLGITDTK